MKGFEKLPKDVYKTFIYTGNNGNVAVSRNNIASASCVLTKKVSQIIPGFLSLGLGKSASWYLMQQLAATERFTKGNCRFYYVDQRTAAGKATTSPSGAAHAEHFWSLTEKDTQGPVLSTFVKGQGYTSFPQSDNAKLPVLTVQEAVDFN